MNYIPQLTALLIFGLTLANHREIGHWLLTHKRMGLGIYIVISWGVFAALIWLLGSLVDML